MRLITKNTDYAVRTVLYLAGTADRFVPANEISRSESIPEYYLRRIQQALVREGILSAKEGAKGGVMLAREPRAILLTDLIRAMQGEIQLSECLFKRKQCPNRATCVLRRRILSAEEKLVREFSGITVQDLLNDAGTSPGINSKRGKR